MARKTQPLTSTGVKQAKPKDKICNLFDGGGLVLRIKPNGAKLWVFEYRRPYSGKRTSMSFGSYPSVSLAEARKQREKAKALLAQNIDPKEHRDEIDRQKAVAESNTLEHIAANWLEIKKAKVSAHHASDIWRSLELHIFPALGNVPIHKITAPKTIDVISPLAAKGKLEAARRICQRVNEVMTYAVNTGLVSSNPLAGIREAFKAPRKEKMPTIPPDELPDFIRTLSRASIKTTTRCLIEWQLHTMVRPGEAAETRWDEINVEAGLWTIPAHRMKKKREHIVPLTDQALELLEIMRPISGNREYVFPADREPRKPANKATANVAIKRMGYHGKLVAHGLRSIASTALNDQGFDPDVIEAALAHTGDNEVRNAYNRANYLERRKPMMQWWSDFISEAGAGSVTLSGNKTLKIAR
jgi:integrase